MKKEFIELTEFVPVGTNNSNQKYNRKEDMSNNMNAVVNSKTAQSIVAKNYDPMISNLTTLEVKNKTAQVEHEATTSKIGEDQIFYLKQRGIATEDAVSMIVNGFCREVFKELPMEFAVEEQKLLGVSLEGSVG